MITYSRIVDLRASTSTSGTGRDGIDGDDGLSAYEIALNNGFVGTEQEWLESLKVTTTTIGRVQIDWIDQNPIAIRKYKDVGLTQLLETITPTFVDGLTLPVTNTQPYTALLSIGAAGCANIKLRNIGTRAVPLSMGSANICGLVYILGTGAAANNVKIQRVYCSGTRTGIMTGDNSSTKVVEENVFGDYADAADVQAVLNFNRKGIGGTLALTAQTAVYGTHFADYFTSTTAGRLAILMNEPTALTASQVTLGNGAAFTVDGGLYMPTFTISGTWGQVHASASPCWCPFIDTIAVGTSVSSPVFNKASTFTARVKARKGGSPNALQPAEATFGVDSGIVSYGVIMNPDE